MASTKSGNRSFVSGLKTEWNLFWETILGDDESDESSEEPPSTKDPFITGKLETLSLEQIKVITKALSSDRKTLNQKLEALKKEIEENASKLDNLSSNPAESDQALQRINELNDLGQSLSEQLSRINERLKIARSREDSIKKSNREAE